MSRFDDFTDDELKVLRDRLFEYPRGSGYMGPGQSKLLQEVQDVRNSRREGERFVPEPIPEGIDPKPISVEDLPAELERLAEVFGDPEEEQ